MHTGEFKGILSLSKISWRQENISLNNIHYPSSVSDLSSTLLAWIDRWMQDFDAARTILKKSMHLFPDNIQPLENDKEFNGSRMTPS